MKAYATQTDRMLALLRQRPHNGLELRTEHGIGAPNSRRSDLENRGYVVVCEHVKGVRGPAGYVYRLVSTPSLEAPAEGTPAPSASASSDDDRSWLHHGEREPTGDSSAEGETAAPSAEPAESEPLFSTAPPGRPRELF